MRLTYLTLIPAIVCLISQLAFAAATPLQKPKLVVVIVVDQLRADYLQRFQERFLPAKGANGTLGGFRYLMSEGAYYPQAQYDVLQSLTCVGHATVLTGAYPYQSGIISNAWYDREAGSLVHCAEDHDSPLVGAPQKDARAAASPKTLRGTTVGDELKNVSEGSRVVSLSIKDRSSIMLGGHRADIAIWFDEASFQWVSSKYYLPQGKLPEWLTLINHNLKRPKIEKPMSKYSEALASSFGLEALSLAADQAMEANKLGNGKAIDLLAISFSPVDFIGHEFGPNSPEIEQIMEAQDQAISRLLNSLNKKLSRGIKDALIVLTSDHGVAPVPSWSKARKMDAGSIDLDQVSKLITQRLEKKFGRSSDGPWVLSTRIANIYLNHKTIASKGLNRTEVENESKDAIWNLPGVAYVFSHTDYQSRKLPPGMHERQILQTYYPGRSGDLIIIPKPNWAPGGENSGNHMTGYAFDRTVPLLLAGPQFRPGLYAQKANPIDIAPTLSFVLGIVPPSLSEGRVLHEALNLK